MNFLSSKNRIIFYNIYVRVSSVSTNPFVVEKI